MRDNLISQLQSSLLLGALSLIPNNALRYTLLIAACAALFYVIHLKRPSTQLNQLEDTIQQTEEIIRDAKLHCPRDLLSLTEGGLRVLEVKRSASVMQCRLLETTTFTWKKYRILSRDISNCARHVEKIRTADQLIVEAERQRKYTDDINETQAMLASLRPPGMLDIFVRAEPRFRGRNLKFLSAPRPGLPEYNQRSCPRNSLREEISDASLLQSSKAWLSLSTAFRQKRQKLNARGVGTR
ncbi:hypothetical protein FB451DRAFT_1441280 [Mycena latifolia]|nr:hypothetical protein FB451DRAFT_1441280 [Mycena latifolia]